ncbi:MAG TPA: hypothetical protein EYG51_14755 [Pseudomonadales bacterium]|nr:hypothetical protein [Pseudomonadales bacterium]
MAWRNTLNSIMLKENTMSLKSLNRLHISMIHIPSVGLDPAMTRHCSTHPIIKDLNEGALSNPRGTIIHADAYTWLRANDESWDVILIDLPDPRRVDLAKLYSTEFYLNVRDHLSPTGVAAIQSTSSVHATKAFTTIWATLTASALHALPYRIYVPSFSPSGCS